MDYKGLGKRLKRLIADSDAKSYEIAEKIGIQRAALSKIMNGHNSPSIDTFVNLCEALDVSPNELLAYEKRQGEPSKEVHTTAPSTTGETVDKDIIIRALTAQIQKLQEDHNSEGLPVEGLRLGKYIAKFLKDYGSNKPVADLSEAINKVITKYMTPESEKPKKNKQAITKKKLG